MISIVQYIYVRAKKKFETHITQENMAVKYKIILHLQLSFLGKDLLFRAI